MSEVKTDSNNVISNMHETLLVAEYPSHIHSLSKVKVSRDNSGRLTVAFPYDPALIAKVKTIEGYKWEPDKRYWSFQNSDRILNKILQVFAEDNVNLDITQPANQLSILDKLYKAVQTRHYSRRTVGKDPVVLTKLEVKTVLGLLEGDKWLMSMLLYGAGLRLMECLRLRVMDIDFSTNQILIRDGKGGKDRVTILPGAVKIPFFEHLKYVIKVH